MCMCIYINIYDIWYDSVNTYYIPYPVSFRSKNSRKQQCPENGQSQTQTGLRGFEIFFFCLLAVKPCLGHLTSEHVITYFVRLLRTINEMMCICGWYTAGI